MTPARCTSRRARDLYSAKVKARRAVNLGALPKRKHTSCEHLGRLLQMYKMSLRLTANGPQSGRGPSAKAIELWRGKLRFWYRDLPL